jgi:hypothetical protein
VTGPGGRTVTGTAEAGPQERSWRFTPRQAWEPGLHRLLADPALEDLAGNSVTRVFDRDLTSPAEASSQASTAQASTAAVAFSVPRNRDL